MNGGMAALETIGSLLRIEHANLGNSGLALLDKGKTAASDIGPILRTAQSQFFIRQSRIKRGSENFHLLGGSTS